MFMNLKMFFTFFYMTILLSACGLKEAKKDTESTRTFNSASYLIVENESLTSNDALISGSGSVVFVAPLLEDANNFLLNFEIEDSGSLTVVTSSDNKLQRGLALIFSRNGKNLQLTTKAGDNTSSSAALVGIDASAPISLSLDVHNDETPAHVMIWKNSDTTELVIDTEEGAEVAGNGQGNLWGLILKAAKVTRSDIRTPAHEE